MRASVIGPDMTRTDDYGNVLPWDFQSAGWQRRHGYR